jgi:hypothetical protein
VGKGYTGSTAAAVTKADITCDVFSSKTHLRIHHPVATLSHRTNQRLDRHCRLDRQYEVTGDPHEGFLSRSQIALLLRRVDRSPVFDTL